MADALFGLHVFTPDSNNIADRTHFPRIAIKSHTDIYATHQHTRLTQTFTNPTDQSHSEVTYSFPLYDGITVTSFQCAIADRIIRGEVQERRQAEARFNEAVSKGRSAALLEHQPAGMFSLNVGNVPARSNVTVELTYAGELKHDAEIDGLRFNLPLSIAPRYGEAGEVFPLNDSKIRKQGIEITVSTHLGVNIIREITTTSQEYQMLLDIDTQDAAPHNATPHTVSLSLDKTEMDEDLVLLIKAEGIAAPQAVQSSGPDYSAVLATFVPKFKLPSIDPEIVFIADQSGSMQGASNESLVAALSVFVKSLPSDLHFNICAFGNYYEFLFTKSQPYNKDTATKALKFIKGLDASYGGTEMQKPVEEAFSRRLKDRPLQLILLTDGEIWGEKKLFDFINEQLGPNKIDAQIFCLGIGQHVSHTLVEGIARAGKGISQFVTLQESLDLKVVRMLKASLYPHLRDVQVTFDEDPDQKDDEYELIDNVKDLVVTSSTTQKASSPVANEASISLYDESTELDIPIAGSDQDTASQIGRIVAPDNFTAPMSHISLFPFNRTTVHAVRPRAAHRIKAITIRATYFDPRTSTDANIDLTIPTVIAQRDDDTIVKLAARKAIQELEEGRGWLAEYTPPGHTQRLGELFKTSDAYDKYLTSACVDLGVKYQVNGFHTSYIAVDATGNVHQVRTLGETKTGTLVNSVSIQFGAIPPPPVPSPAASGGLMAKFSTHGYIRDPNDPGQIICADGSRCRTGGRTKPSGLSEVGGSTAIVSTADSIPASSPTPALRELKALSGSNRAGSGFFRFGVFGGSGGRRGWGSSSGAHQDTNRETKAEHGGDTDVDQLPDLSSKAARLRALIHDQDFDGSWASDVRLGKILKAQGLSIDMAAIPSTGHATVLIILALSKHFADLEDVWELIAAKAEKWVADNLTKEQKAQYEKIAAGML